MARIVHGGFWVHQRKSVGGDEVDDSEHGTGLGSDQLVPTVQIGALRSGARVEGSGGVWAIVRGDRRIADGDVGLGWALVRAVQHRMVVSSDGGEDRDPFLHRFLLQPLSLLFLRSHFFSAPISSSLSLLAGLVGLVVYGF